MFLLPLCSLGISPFFHSEVCQTRLESQGTGDFIEKDAENNKKWSKLSNEPKKGPLVVQGL